MNEKRVTPKFLTKEVTDAALEIVTGTFERPPLDTLLRQQGCHIVVLVPSKKDDRETDLSTWPKNTISPKVMYQRSIGARTTWTANYDDIARCKALQLWHERNDDRTDIMPHLLFPGDTPFWGGVRRHGIVVTCSGFQPWLDKMVAGMIADALIALAYNAWMISDDKKNDVDFLT